MQSQIRACSTAANPKSWSTGFLDLPPGSECTHRNVVNSRDWDLQLIASINHQEEPSSPHQREGDVMCALFDYNKRSHIYLQQSWLLQRVGRIRAQLRPSSGMSRDWSVRWWSLIPLQQPVAQWAPSTELSYSNSAIRKNWCDVTQRIRGSWWPFKTRIILLKPSLKIPSSCCEFKHYNRKWCVNKTVFLFVELEQM